MMLTITNADGSQTEFVAVEDKADSIGQSSPGAARGCRGLRHTRAWGPLI